MAKMFLMAFFALMMISQTPAIAQVTVLDGKYAEGNVIRVVTRVKMPAPPASAYKVAMLKVATMAGQKGFTRLAIIKIDDCVSIAIGYNSSPVVQTCKIFGQMVNEDEIAEPKGKEPVRYYSLKKMDNGIYIPTPEKEGSVEQR